MKRLTTMLALTVGLAVAPSAFADAPPAFHDGDGLQIVSVKQLDPRLYALVVKTPALPNPANVWILLPPDYASAPRKHWPVFYLLHGTSGTASDWVKTGNAEKVIGDRELITVMPDIALNDDGGGWCTNWPNGAELWEKFHIEQLIPWVDSSLRTIPRRQGRAIAGLSQGGFCSMSYAARHPDLFSTALGYSGAPDIYHDYEERAGAAGIIGATEFGLTHVPPGTFFGDPVTNGINWAAHDPTSIAENLRWTRMYMYWGNGQPGPLDTQYDQGTPGAMLIEGAVDHSNQGFQNRLNALRIPAYFDPYGNGTHTWAYWTRDLQQSIDKIMSDFASPAPNPAQFTYTSGDDSYAVYGWSVATRRTAREFSTLGASRCGDFSLSGSGSAAVTTPACLEPGARYRVTITGLHADKSDVMVAGGDRRLTLDVPLGPPNPYQQETVEAQAAGTAVYTTAVTIDRLPASRSSARTRTRAKRLAARRSGRA